MSEATVNLRNARPAAVKSAPVRRTIFVRTVPLSITNMRRQRAAMLADVRNACESAWKPTEPADTHFVCIDAWEIEVLSWSESQHGLAGELTFQELTAEWVARWNELDDAHRLKTLAEKAGRVAHDDARSKYLRECRSDFDAEMQTPSDAFDEWAFRACVSEEQWGAIKKAFEGDWGWKYAAALV